MVGLHCFGDLGTDWHDRIEGGHGFLEDHGDVAAAVAAHGFGWDGEEGLARKGNVSSDLGGLWKESEDGQGGSGFAGAGLSDQAQGLAGVDMEGDVVDGRVGAEAYGQVGYFEYGAGVHW